MPVLWIARLKLGVLGLNAPRVAVQVSSGILVAWLLQPDSARNLALHFVCLAHAMSRLVLLTAKLLDGALTAHVQRPAALASIPAPAAFLARLALVVLNAHL